MLNFLSNFWGALHLYIIYPFYFLFHYSLTLIVCHILKAFSTFLFHVCLSFVPFYVFWLYFISSHFFVSKFYSKISPISTLFPLKKSNIFIFLAFSPCISITSKIPSVALIYKPFLSPENKTVPGTTSFSL